MHSDIWGALTEIIDNYCKIERIKEVLHSKHSNTNEALNHAAVSHAPKGIHYASSSSLESRVHTMIAIHNMGHQQFVNTILTSLGSRVGCYLHEWAIKRDRDKDSKRERERKKGRKFARKMGTDKEWAWKVKENQLEKQGTIGYKSGIGLDTEAMLSKLDNNKVSNTMASKKICRSGCGLTGHYDRRDLFCPLNPINQKNKQQFNSDATNEEMRQDSIEATTNQAGTYQGPNFEAAADNVVGPSAEIEEDSLTGCVDDWCSESGGEEMIFFDDPDFYVLSPTAACTDTAQSTDCAEKSEPTRSLEKCASTDSYIDADVDFFWEQDELAQKIRQLILDDDDDD